MTQLKATPGPWEWVAEDASMATLLNSGGDHVLSSTICKSCQQKRASWKWGRCYTASAANARLIAAAPELYEALEEIAKGQGAFSRDPLTHAENTIDDMKGIALAALAKARGETP